MYPEHLPLTKIQAGLKSGRYLQVLAGTIYHEQQLFDCMIGTFDTGVKFSGDHTLIFFNHIIFIENGLPGVRSTLKNLHY